VRGRQFCCSPSSGLAICAGTVSSYRRLGWAMLCWDWDWGWGWGEDSSPGTGSVPGSSPGGGAGVTADVLPQDRADQRHPGFIAAVGIEPIEHVVAEANHGGPQGSGKRGAAA
jgi:hypothetical protein